MSRFRLEITLSEDQLARLDAARRHEPRASFVKRALEAFVDRDPMTKLVQDGPGLSEEQLRGGMSAIFEQTAAYVDQTAEMPKPKETAADWAMERQRKMNERREK